MTEVAKKYAGRLNVAVLYTLEAHPVGDPSPYAEYSPELENPEHPGERPGGNVHEDGFLAVSPRISKDERSWRASSRSSSISQDRSSSTR